MSQIERVHARQILDSRGNPAVEVEVGLRSGAQGRAAVPSGASTGEFEATELRDGGDAWMGKGVSRAVENINGEIAPHIRGMEAAGRPRPAPTSTRAGPRAPPPPPGAADPQPLGRYLGGETANVLPVPMMNVLNG